jgi:hypothetical protein
VKAAEGAEAEEVQEEEVEVHAVMLQQNYTVMAMK